MSLWENIQSAYEGYGRYFVKMISKPFDFPPNGFYFLIFVSLIVWGLEIAFPWRKKQAIFRKDFWLDTFYMFFNFFFFNLLIFAALSKVTYKGFISLVESIGLPNHLFNLSQTNPIFQFILFFLLLDFVQWCVHILLHRIPFLWKFHKVHHSVEEMGFAAHLRYHFMENIVYTVAKYFLLSYIFNFNIEYATYIYLFGTLIGHLNHANINLDYGPLKYIFNNPRMHIWHHSKELPDSHSYGMNFGITLSCWDYLFGTAYIPKSGRDIQLGFEEVEKYPHGFLSQMMEPFKSKK